MTPLATMREAVGSMERVRALLLAGERLEPTVLWVCACCAALSPEPVCSPECEAEMRRYEEETP